MAVTNFSPLLGLALPTTGDLSGTWGTTVNDSITGLIDSAVAGTATLSTDADVTLTTTNGAANQARNIVLLFSGARTAIRTVTAPAQSKTYIVINATTGGFAVKLVGAGPTTGLTIPNGASATVSWNGSDFIEVGSGGTIGNLTVNGTLTVTGATTLQSTLAVTGNITNTAGTANGVAYLNGSKVLTSGSALTFDGTKFTQTASTTAAAGLAEFKNTATGSQTGNILASNDSGTAVSMRVFGSAAGTYGMLTAGSPMLYTAASELNLVADNASGVIKFGLNSAAESMRLTSTGLGIGTTSPSSYSAKLAVVSTAADTRISVVDDVANARGGYLRSNFSDAVILGTTSGVRDLVFSPDNTERMRINTTGNVGIGTSSPSSKLDIVGVTQWQATAGTVLGKLTYSGGEPVVLANTGLGLRFFTNNTQTAIIDSSGNLGVGTTSPSVTIHANASGGGAIRASRSSVSGEYIQIDHDGTNGTLRASGANALIFNTNSAERVRITSAGDVGIGTTSPTQLLTARKDQAAYTWGRFENQSTSASAYAGVVVGAFGNSWGLAIGSTAANGNDLTFLLDAGGANQRKMELTSGGNLGVGNFAPYDTWGNSYVAIQVANAARSLAATGAASGDLTLAFNAVYDSTDSRWEYVSTGDKAGRYSQTGGSDAHVWYVTDSNGTAGNAITFTQAMTLNSSGNLGIGTTSPTNRLQVESGSTANGGQVWSHSSGTVYARIGVVNPGVNNNTAFGSVTNNSIVFLTNDTERARLNENANLLVGATSSSFNERIVSQNGSSYTFGSYRTGTGSEGHCIFVNGNGAVGSIFTNGSATAYNTSSDYRLKNITGALTGYKERLMSLQPKQGTWIADGSEFRGFLAHEFAQPYRASVTGEKDAVDAEGKPVMQGMQASSSEVMADLIAMVNELITENASLKARLDAANL